MSARSGAVHVATTKREYKGRVYETHLLRRTYREGGKVKHETVGNLSHLPKPVIELIRGSLRGETYLPANSAFECTRSLPHGHVAAVLGALRKCGLESLLASRESRDRNLVTAMIVSRVIDPCSKLATARSLSKNTAASSLGHVLAVDNCSEDELYDAMDWLRSRQEAIENKLAAKHLSENTLVLYDVTSTYFEGRKCPLAALGHSRDGKKNKLQIVFGILCTKDGCPVAVEVFEGNTADPRTVSSQVRKIRERFGLERVVIVGDRGMLTEARISQDLQDVEGLSWITALRAPAIRGLLEKGELHRSLFDKRDIAEIKSPDYPGERLVACFNPLLAEERRRKRADLLAATDRDLEKIAEATRRVNRPLRGKETIGLKVGRVLYKHKMGKHFKLVVTDDSFTYARREDKIAAEELLDGIYIIRTDVPKSTMTAPETVRAYKSLSTVERAFRCMKTIDLKVRPIYHYSEDRVRSHVFLCMLAYYVEWHMRGSLAPILFQDAEPEAGRALRKSEVAPAQRSPEARRKIAIKSTEDGLPVHSFRTLLDDLGTIVMNFMRPNGETATFELMTNLTPVQRRAFDLLDVPLTA